MGAASESLRTLLTKAQRDCANVSVYLGEVLAFGLAAVDAAGLAAGCDVC